MNPARLILAVRRPEAGETAAESIAMSPGINRRPEVWKLDMADLASVKSFAARCESELDRLDILVNLRSLPRQGLGAELERIDRERRHKSLGIQIDRDRRP